MFWLIYNKHSETSCDFQIAVLCGGLYLVSNMSIPFDLGHEIETISMCTHILAEDTINYRKPISNTIGF